MRSGLILSKAAARPGRLAGAAPLDEIAKLVEHEADTRFSHKLVCGLDQLVETQTVLAQLRNTTHEEELGDGIANAYQ